MAYPLRWPSKYLFYPIGNTPAVCLSRDLAPEEPANILLLGCGDPRNVLYTIMSEPKNTSRRLDFTCCDIDAAILARNIILFTLVADDVPHTIIWNIFFHFRLDDASYSTLLDHCRKLIEFSDSLQSWKASPYGSFIKMCTEHTLQEVRRHWSLYVDLQGTKRRLMDAVFTKQVRLIAKEKRGVSLLRSLGPVMVVSLAKTLSDQFNNYWLNGGVTFTDPKLVAAAILLNPTFLYSWAGRHFSVHYGTNPIQPFHLAALCGNAKSPISVIDVVNTAQAEFQGWCFAFRMSIFLPTFAPPIIRFFLGDATLVCRALSAFNSTQRLKSDIPVSQWSTELMHLNGDEYISDGAPTSFSVIETSNLADHVGLLNVMIVSVPLLSMPFGIFYTESLLYGSLDATTEFTQKLYADLNMIGLLLGIFPVDYLSGFTTRSNVHELMMYEMLKDNAPQFHQVVTWKSTSSGDPLGVQSERTSSTLEFDSRALGTFLYDMYHQMFQQEDSGRFHALNADNIAKAIARSHLVRYTREGFVLLLKLIKDRLYSFNLKWVDVMGHFFDIEDFMFQTDKTSMDTLHYNDLCSQLYYHGVYKIAAFRFDPHVLSKVPPYVHWDTVPALVRIVLVVPRENLLVLDHSQAGKLIGTPPLLCSIRGTRCLNLFHSVHAAFGNILSVGTKNHPSVILEEDKKGMQGSSSLVASFIVPSRLLAVIEPPKNLDVTLGIWNLPNTLNLMKALDSHFLDIFKANLLDDSFVHILPEYPLPSAPPPRVSTSTSRPPTFIASSPQSSQPPGPRITTEIGQSDMAVVELDEQCELVESLMIRFSVDAEEARRSFVSGTLPQVSQASPCVMMVSIGGLTQHLVYPMPIIGSSARLNLARKSLFVEVIVPISAPFTKPDGMKLNPFPVINSNSSLHLWSIHRVNLSCLPIVGNTPKRLEGWLNNHVGATMSARERSERKKHKEDILMFIKDSIHTIFIRSAGTQHGRPSRVFSLRDDATNNCDTILFVNELRYDLHSHTVICDGYVLPLTPELTAKMAGPLRRLVAQGTNVKVFEGEMKAWKQLLPAFVERCRTQWKHGANCEYASQGKIPLTEDMEKNPLCGCGSGKEIDGMKKDSLWRNFAPHVTRVALSPLFAVSYLESVGRELTKRMCSVCRGKGKPKLHTCGRCKKVLYCSAACQTKDWKVHRSSCKLPAQVHVYNVVD